MALITDLPAATSLASADLLVIDTGSATRKIAAYNLFRDTICGEGTEFASGDLDTLNAVGHYRLSAFSGLTNAPSITGAQSGELFIFYRGALTRLFQLAFVYRGTSTPAIALRAQTGVNTWGSWASIIPS